MGYKLAGCDVIAANDIDPEMAWHYKENLHPASYYLCPISDLKYWHKTKPGKSYSDTKKGLGEKAGCFSHVRIDGDKPSSVLTANLQTMTHWDFPRELTFPEVIRLGSFPDDYCAKSDNIGKYMIGMSVPPKMAEYVAREVCRQWLGVVD